MTIDVGLPFKSLIEDVYIPLFHEKGEDVISMVVNLTVPRMAFLAAYRNLPPFEQTDEDGKLETMKYVSEMFPDKTPEEQMEACRIVYTIGTIL